MALYFAVTLFVSAFLLFLIQPMVGKMVLPLAGGSPAVWSACMVFYQALLLVGYAYAHASTTHLGVRRQSVFHVFILVLPVLALAASAAISGSPVHAFKALAPPGGAFPFFGVLLVLAVAIGLPFLVVATSAPLLQRWFADTNHRDARDPYFLYSASNLGSLMALIAYPALIEPSFRLATQAWLWAAGYAVLVALTIGCAQRLRASPPPAPSPAAKRKDAAPSGGEQPLAGRSPHHGALPKSSAPPKRLDDMPSWGHRLRWLALAFVPTSLLLGVTSFLTTDITPMPLLWVIPLGLYLLTFIIAFGRTPYWLQKAVELITPVAVLILVWTLLSGKKPDSWAGVVSLHLIVFLFVALNCHMELARRRPAPSRLTEFYLWVSLGGVLGGLFNALVAPLVFTGLTEYPLALILACLLQPPGDSAESDSRAWILDLLIPVGVGAITWALLTYVSIDYLPKPLAKFPIPSSRFYKGGPWDVMPSTLWSYLVYGLPMLVAYFWVERPVRFGLAIGALWLVGTWHTTRYEAEVHDRERVLHRERSFFGMLSVDELQEPDDAGLPLIYHKLVHGTTLHGKQHYASVGNMAEFLSALGAGSAAEAAVDLASASARLESERHEPLTYYHRTGPIGQVLAERLPAIANGELAFVGLGSGTMAAYVEPGQKATFYELDSAIKRIAENPEYFTFLHDCKGTYQIVLGDARLKMEDHGRDHQYGLIVVDAFSSDAIPVHLLTKEAVELYRKRLAPGGVIALHISNRYLELKPVAARIAQELGMVALHQWDSDANAAGKQTSEWVLVANQRADFGGLTDRTYEGDDDSGNKVTLHRWSDVKPDARSPLWTDDFSNFLQIMQWKQIFKMGDW